ncbi:hypothetical protein [Stenotrophomonas indicatrix]|uniref:hypothetical protein n=1 Tax=Stenotrophomonas indicatrix TaxID=2045451 RepID=UPI002896C1D3|nr:hypothetical protein [Stenotrophomonas indicatrix]
MSIGARIRSEDGSLVQVDPQYENLCLRDKGVVRTEAFGTNGASRNAGVATIQLSGCNEPLLMVRCAGVFVGLRSRDKVGATYSWQLIASSPVVDVEYWVFDTTNVAQMAFVTSKGLRIRNPDDGRVIFDSRYKYMRVLKWINTTMGTGAQSHAIPVASDVAVGFGNASLSTLIAGGPVSGGGYWLYQVTVNVAGFMTTSDGQIQSRLITINSFTNEGQGTPPYGGGIIGSFNASALVCDVSNY